MTEGEWRVGVAFNPSGDPDVDRVKQTAAALIDEILAARNRISTVFDGSEFWSSDDDLAAEQIECFDQAARQIEQAAMWAVKGLTKRAKPASGGEPAYAADDEFRYGGNPDEVGW